jgi:hypothetical protein
MKKQIEETLQCLIGHPFWGAGRAADLSTFQFGPRHMRTRRRDGRSYEVGTYALHVQCAWHLADAQHILVASRDRYYPRGDPDDESLDQDTFRWDQPGANRCDERLEQFFKKYETTPVIVQTIQADNLGGMTIKLSQNHTLVVFPDDSLDGEYWRFFQTEKDLPHFVVTGHGIEDEEG